MDIEKKATSAVTDSIADTELLSSFINSDDKEPSWDGHIYVYSNKNKTKDTLIGRVPVQVKGKICENISISEITYSVAMSDLRNYLTGVGVIYFVVLINNKAETKIFYSDLLPVKLKSLLSDKKTQKIKLKEFPKDNNYKQSIFLNFTENSIKQASFAKSGTLLSIENLQKPTKIEKLTTTIFGIDEDDRKDPIRMLLKKEIYFYAQYKGHNILQPLDTPISAIEIQEQVKACISVKGTQFYRKFTRIRSKDLLVIKIGKSITLGLDNGKLEYCMTENLRDIVIDLDFIIHVFYAKSYEINGEQILIDLNNSKSFDIKEQELLLTYYKKVVQVLDYLNIQNDIIISQLTNEDERNLKILVTAFADKQPVNGLKITSPLSVMRISKFKLLLICLPNKEDANKTDIYDFSQLNSHLVTFTDEDGKHKPISQYVKLEKNDYLKYSNIRHNTILSSFQMCYSHDNPKVIEGANKVLLDLLAVYDESKKPEILQTARDLAEWLLQINQELISIEIYQLNLLQSIRRERELTKNEKNILKTMALNNNNPNEILFGANLLLGNQELAEEYFERLDTTVQKVYRQYPIFKFWKG